MQQLRSQKHPPRIPPFMFHYQVWAAFRPPMSLPPVAICLQLSRSVALPQNCRHPSRAVSTCRRSSPGRKYFSLHASQSLSPIPLVNEGDAWPTTGFRTPETASHNGARKSQPLKPASSGYFGLRSRQLKSTRNCLISLIFLRCMDVQRSGSRNLSLEIIPLMEYSASDGLERRTH